MRAARPQLEREVLAEFERLQETICRRLDRGEDARDEAEVYEAASRCLSEGRLADARLALSAGRVPATALRKAAARKEAGRVIQFADLRQRARAGGR